MHHSSPSFLRFTLELLFYTSKNNIFHKINIKLQALVLTIRCNRKKVTTQASEIILKVRVIVLWLSSPYIIRQYDCVIHRYWLFRAWGRIGTTIGGNKVENCHNLLEGIQKFEEMYEERTKNSWYNRDNFVKVSFFACKMKSIIIYNC